MKKLLLFLTILSSISVVNAQFTQGDIEYTVTDAVNLKVEVSGSTLTDPVVPAKVTDVGGTGSEYDVVGIGANAFFNKATNVLNTIELPASVKKIGNQSFRSAPLTQITFTTVNALDTIDVGAFRISNNLTNIDNILASTAPTLTIIGNAFQQIVTPSIVFPSNNIVFESSTNFFNTSPLITSIDLSAVTFTAIPATMFRGTGITNMNLSSTPIDSIGNAAFRDCVSLETVNLGSVNNVSASVFRNCDALRTVITNQVTPPVYITDVWNRIEDPSLITVYVPTAAAKTAFEADAEWNKADIVVGTGPTLSTNILEQEEVGIYVDQSNTLSINSNSTINTSVYVYDITGNQLLKENITNSLTVDLSHLTSGVYIVRVNNTVKKISL